MARSKKRKSNSAVLTVPVLDPIALASIGIGVPTQFNLTTRLRADFVAVEILRRTFGLKWLNRYIFDARHGDFLMKEDGRVMELAEMIMNLHIAPGILDILKQVAGGQIESAFAELEAGRVLAIHGAPFEFVPASAVAGYSFDLKLGMRGPHALAADTKCKMEGGKCSVAGVIGSLDDARKRNVHKDLMAAVFVKIPAEYWDGSFMDNLGVACQSYINSHRRIASVVLFCSGKRVESGRLKDFRRYREIAQCFGSPGGDGDLRILSVTGQQPVDVGAWRSILSI